jgi:hypothetical protein
MFGEHLSCGVGNLFGGRLTFREAACTQISAPSMSSISSQNGISNPAKRLKSVSFGLLAEANIVSESALVKD